jgi:hypothetical protein
MIKSPQPLPAGGGSPTVGGWPCGSYVHRVAKEPPPDEPAAYQTKMLTLPASFVKHNVELNVETQRFRGRQRREMRTGIRSSLRYLPQRLSVSAFNLLFQLPTSDVNIAPRIVVRFYFELAMDPSRSPASGLPSPRVQRVIEAAIELPLGLALFAFGISLLRPAMWWLNARNGFQNSPTDVTTIKDEGYSTAAAALVALISGLCFVIRAAWLLYIRRRKPGG